MQKLLQRISCLKVVKQVFDRYPGVRKYRLPTLDVRRNRNDL